MMLCNFTKNFVTKNSVKLPQQIPDRVLPPINQFLPFPCIAPTNTGAPSASSTQGKRLGTRGANRGEKTEIRSALKKQAARSYENLDEVILDFVSKNRDSLFQCML